MADIELVIKIPKEQYSLIMQSHRNGVPRFVNKKAIMYAIKNGTPLPEGHGDLIDADELRTEMDKDVRRAMSFVDLKDFVWLASTIIKADKGE